MSTRHHVVGRFFELLWNQQEMALVDELLVEDVTFRGSLGDMLNGRDAFRGYVMMVREAFPDWFSRIDEILEVDDNETVVARMTYEGSHEGYLRGVAPTGRRIRYVGAAIFRFTGDRIREVWVVGDTQELWKSLIGVDQVPPVR